MLRQVPDKPIRGISVAWSSVHALVNRIVFGERHTYRERMIDR